MASLSYSKLLDPVSDVIACMESILSGAVGSATGDQRECFKRIHAYSWGLHTLVMDVITAIGIENSATSPAVLDRFNSLIRPIKSNLDNLVGGYDGELNEEQDLIIAFVVAATMSIEHMMTNLWHYSLLKHNKLEFSPEPFDCSVLARKLRSVLTTAALPSALPTARVNGDKGLLSYAVGEIAINVWQHGSVDDVRLETAIRAGHVDLTVIDTGAGFRADDVTSPFQPFWQSDQRNRGLGLGLYLAKAFIDMCGGSIALDSAPSKGTIVSVSLLLAD